MSSTSQRVIGSAVFAVLFTIAMLAAPVLRQESVDLAQAVISFLAAGLIGYRVWPGLAVAWAQRDRAEDGRRLAWLVGGIVAAILLEMALSRFAGPDQAAWSFALFVGLLVLLTAAVMIQVRRARRS